MNNVNIPSIAQSLSDIANELEKIRRIEEDKFEKDYPELENYPDYWWTNRLAVDK